MADPDVSKSATENHPLIRINRMDLYGRSKGGENTLALDVDWPFDRAVQTPTNVAFWALKVGPSIHIHEVLGLFVGMTNDND